MSSAKMGGAFTIMAFIFVCIHAMPVDDSGLTIRIVHTNDMHARFEQTSKYSTSCSQEEAISGKCYGGFARLATLIRQARNSSSNTIFLNAGDTYQGSIWYGVHKWKIVAKFLNILAPDAISLGNHEFDDGVKGLVPFINEAQFPIVTANLDLSNEPTLKSSKLLNSTILTVNGTQIGVIGYLTPLTKNIALTDNVKFLDEVEVVREEAKKLKAQGVKILIAVGHSGYLVDEKIAKDVEDIDLVIGGHSNTFLYSGEKPDSEIPEGLYPTEIVQESGRKVYVVQAYAYTKYLGNLTVKFDENGEITFIKGNPILVDAKIDQAEDVLTELDKWRPEIESMKTKIVGYTKVLLNGDSKFCRKEECNLGNLITDAMIKYNVKEYDGVNGWTDAAIAVHNGGSIRTSITRQNNDQITSADVKDVLPFGNVLFKTNMSGKKLLEILEFSVKSLTLNNVTSDLNGGFLQVSGLQVVYDLSQEYMSKVVSVKVRCAACKTPSYSVLQKDATYTVLLTDFLSRGGDNYDMLKDLEYISLGATTDEVVEDYLKTESPVYPGVEWRITFETPEKLPSPPSEPNSASIFHSLTLLLLLPLISLLWNCEYLL